MEMINKTKSNLLLSNGLTTDHYITKSKSWHIHLMNISRICSNKDICTISGSTERGNLLQFAKSTNNVNYLFMCIWNDSIKLRTNGQHDKLLTYI